MTRLLTEIADYDEDGSWGRMSEGWPGVRGDKAYDMYVFGNCVATIPYGSYVLMSEKGKYGAKETYLRVHADHIGQLHADFEAAGQPTPNESIDRREKTGVLLKYGNRGNASAWWK